MIPKRNIISDQLVSFVDPSDNRGYPRGTLVIDLASAMSKNAVLVKTESPFGYDGPNGAYPPVFCTILDGQTDPFSGTAAYLLTETTTVPTPTATTHNVRAQDISVASNGWYADVGFTDKAIYTHSIYAKANGSRNILLQSSNAANNNMTFNFTTQAITHSQPTNVVDSGYKDVGGGWYRIWYTMKYLGVSTSPNIAAARLYIYITNNNGATTYTGDGSSGLYFYGHQWQNGPLTNYDATLNAGTYSVNGVDSTRQNVFRTKTMQPSGTTYPTGPASTSYSPEAGGCIQYDDVDGNGTRSALTSAHSHINWGQFNYNGGFSVFAWVKLDATADPIDKDTGLAGDWCVILGRIGGKTNNNDFAIKKDGTQFWFNGRWRNSLNGQNNQAVVSDSFSSVSGNWVCVGMTVTTGTLFSKPTLTFFIDGVQFGSTKQPTGAATGFSNGIDVDSSTGLFLGYDSNTTTGVGNWGQYKGKIGITAVYTKKLTAAEILYNYEATRYRYV